jgi:hypothetical protein
MFLLMTAAPFIRPRDNLSLIAPDDERDGNLIFGAGIFPERANTVDNRRNKNVKTALAAREVGS